MKQQKVRGIPHWNKFKDAVPDIEAMSSMFDMLGKRSEAKEFVAGMSYIIQKCPKFYIPMANSVVDVEGSLLFDDELEVKLPYPITVVLSESQVSGTPEKKETLVPTHKISIFVETPITNWDADPSATVAGSAKYFHSRCIASPIWSSLPIGFFFSHVECRLVTLGATFRVYTLFLHRFRIVKVPLAFRHQPDVLMCLRAAVCHALGHRVRLGPNNVIANVPAVCLRSQGEAGRDEAEVFGLECADVPGRCAHASVIALLFCACCVRVFSLPWAGSIGVTQIYPASPIVPQHPPHFTHHQNQMTDERFRRGFFAQPAGHRRDGQRRKSGHGAVLHRGPFYALFARIGPQPPVGRAGHNAMD
jgi:hypothetical protein